VLNASKIFLVGQSVGAHLTACSLIMQSQKIILWWPYKYCLEELIIERLFNYFWRASKSHPTCKLWSSNFKLTFYPQMFLLSMLSVFLFSIFLFFYFLGFSNVAFFRFFLPIFSLFFSFHSKFIWVSQHHGWGFPSLLVLWQKFSIVVNAWY